MAKIEIYTTPFCGYCARAKGLLDSKGAAYDEMDVMMDDKKRTEMRERAKRSTVPQIFINGQHIGGSDDLAALEQAGKLDALLAQVGTHKGSNRKTYGHSIAIAPWGEVLADAGGEKAGFVIADIDLAKVAEARKMVPSLQHDRKYAAPVLHRAEVAKAAE